MFTGCCLYHNLTINPDGYSNPNFPVNVYEIYTKFIYYSNPYHSLCLFGNYGLDP